MARSVRPATRRRLALLTSKRTIARAIATVLYAGFARHLPWSPRPLGRYARLVRAALAKRMLDSCGEHVNIEHGALFGSGRGINLGDRSDIGMDALIIGPVDIGRDVMMGPRCILLASTHGHADVAVSMNKQGMMEDKPIVIEDDVWLGAGSVVLPGRTLGRGCIVGAGSVVTRDVPPLAVAAGNPAKVIKHRTGSAAASASSPEGSEIA